MTTTVEMPTVLYFLYIVAGWAFWIWLLLWIGGAAYKKFASSKMQTFNVRVSLMNPVETGYRFRNVLDDGHVILSDTIQDSKEKVELYIVDTYGVPRRFIRINITDEAGL